MQENATAPAFDVEESGNVKLRFGEKISYSLGGLAENITLTTTNTFMLFFYTDIFGISAAIVGTMMLVSKVLDILISIAFGYLFDRTKSRFGSARAWILWFTPLNAIALVLAFFVPSFGPIGKIIYAFVTYNLLLSVSYSAIHLSYGVLNSRMTRDQLQRSDMSVFRTIAVAVSNTVITLITLKIVKFFGNTAASWTLTMVLYAVVAILLFGVTFLFTKERVAATPLENKTKSGKHASFLGDVGNTFKNKYALLATLLTTVNAIMMGMQAVFIYYCTYTLKNADLLGLRNLAGGIAAILIMVMLHPFVKKFGKRNVSFIGTIIQTIGLLMILINPSSIPLSIVAAVVYSIGFSTFAGLKYAIVSDSVEYGEWKLGIRNEGMIFSVIGIALKLGTGIGTAITGGLLALSNYVPSAATEPASTMTAILWLMAILPAVCSIIQAILLWVYKLDKQYPTIIKEIAARKASA